MSHPHPAISGWAEPAALAVVGGVLLQVLPAVAALFAVFWYVFCMWESAIGQRWRSRWRGLFYLARGTPMPPQDTEIAALKKQLSDMQHAREDRLLLAIVLGLAGAGAAMALLVTLGF